MATEQKLEQVSDTEQSEAQGTEVNENAEGVEVKKGLLSNPIVKWGLFIGGPLLLLGIITAVLFILGVFGGAEEEHAAAKEPEVVPIAEQLHDVFTYALPSMLINLRTTGRRTSFLKVTISLEVKGNEENKKEMDQLKPRIVDQFQTYLRELEVDDLQGSAGLQRLKEELLDRVNSVTAPIKVQNVLFGELLVQ
jgi:flagellar protein FliL